MQRRRGLSVLELLVAVALLAALLTVSLEMITALAHQRQSLGHRQQALEEAANRLEQIALMPWEELTSEKLTAVRMSPDAQRSLPNAELKIAVAEQPQEPEARRIVVSVRWQGSDSQPDRSVRLVAWRYRRK